MNSSQQRNYLISNADKIIYNEQKIACQNNQCVFDSIDTNAQDSDLKENYLFNFNIQSYQRTPVISEQQLFKKH